MVLSRFLRVLQRTNIESSPAAAAILSRRLATLGTPSKNLESQLIADFRQRLKEAEAEPRNPDTAFPEPQGPERQRQTEEAERFFRLSCKDHEEPPPPLINLAGKGNTAWRVLDWNDAQLVTWWQVDLAGGEVQDNERNALLSDEAKELIYYKHHAEGATVPQLAEKFRVRQQRVMAILALKKIEKQRTEEGKELYQDLADLFEGGRGVKGDGSDGAPGIWTSDELRGSGERHVRILPKAPSYEITQKKDGSIERRDWEAEEKHLAEEEERHLVADFEERLAYNMGEAGKEIDRRSVRKTAPKRPKGGYSLVVQPLGKEKQPAFVAQPGGAHRALDPSEAFYLQRKKPKPRRRIL